MSESVSLRGRWVVLRHTRLGRLPPALYATECLSERGVPCLVIEFGETVTEDASPARYPCRRLSPPLARRLPWPFRHPAIFVAVLSRLLLGVLRDGRPCGFVAHGLQEQTLAWLLGKITRRPWIAHVHEGYDGREPFSPFNRILFWLEGRALRAARFLIFPQATRARIYQRRYRLRSLVAVVANCPRLRTAGRAVAVRTELGLPPDSQLLAYVGGIGPHNGLEETIEALGSLSRVHLLLWGWGEPEVLERLRAGARRFGCEGRVHLLGTLGAEKWSWLEGCDAGLCLYAPVSFRLRHAATASNKLMEYWAAGLPVLASARGEFRRLVEGLDVGVCAETLCPTAIATALARLLSDDELRRSRGEKARRAHRERFHFEHQFRSALAFFEKHSPAPRLTRERSLPLFGALLR